jgi:hypothetical protein
VSIYFEFAQGDAVTVDEAPHPLRLWPAVGGALIQISVNVSGTETASTRGYQVAAEMWVSRNSSNLDSRLLCRLNYDSPLSIGREARPVMLKGLVTDAQLRAAEELRAGAGHLWVSLRISLTRIEASSALAVQSPALLVQTTARLAEKTSSLDFSLSSGDWCIEFERARAGAYVEILVPVTANGDRARDAQSLATARDLVQNGQYASAVIEARKVVEAARREYDTKKVASVARPINHLQRTKDQRWAVAIEDFISLMGGAAHSDPGGSAEFEWDRDEAIALLGVAASLLKRVNGQAGNLGE